MARLYLLLLLIDVVLAVYCFIDCIVTPRREIRGLPKSVWLLLLILLWPFAWIAWLALGRASSSDGDVKPSISAARGRGLHRAPDDDPEFLRGLPSSPGSNEPTGDSGGSESSGGSGGSRPPRTPRSPSSPGTPGRGTPPPRNGSVEEQFQQWEEDMRRREDDGREENS